jgi:hypothetical protein
MGKLCISVHFTARCTPCIAFMLVAHTCTFVIFVLVALWLLWERSWIWTSGSDGRRAVDCVRSPSSRV